MPTVATVLSDEDQLAYTFKFWELLLVQVPLALTCNVDPGASSALAGVTASLFRVAEPTVSPVVPVALALAKLKEALTWAVPTTTPLITPGLLPGVPNAATAPLSELHVTEGVMSCVEESLNTPVAVNAWCQPIGIVWLTGVTVMD